MSDRECFGKWLTEQLMDKSNPYSSNHIFVREEDVFRYFGVDDNESLIWKITYQGTKKDKKQIEQCFKGLDLDLEKLIYSIISSHKNQPVTSDFIDALASLIVRSEPCGSTLIQIFKQASFKYKHVDNCYTLYHTRYDDKDIAINKYFGSEIISAVQLDAVEELLDFYDNEFIKYHLSSILKRLFSEGSYTFNKAHIPIMLEEGIAISQFVSSYHFDKTPPASLNEFINGVIEVYKENGIDAETIKKLMVDNYSSYQDLLKNYPELSECEQIQAAFSLEQLKTGGQSIFDNEMYFWDNISGKKTPEPSPISDFRNMYPDKDWIPILSYITSYIAGSKNLSKDIAIHICEQIIDADSSHKEIFIDILDSIRFMKGNIELSEVRCKGIGFALMLNQSKLPSLPIFEYGTGESSNWYDNYEVTLYDHLNIAPLDGLSDLNSDDLIQFIEVLKAANKADAHFVVISQALVIQETLKSWFISKPIINVFLSSLSKINLKEIESLSSDLQKAILYITLKYDISLSQNLLKHVSIKELNGKSTSEVIDKNKLNSLLLENIQVLNKILNMDLNDAETQILDIQSNVIGRVKKYISHQDGILAIVIMSAIKNSLIEFCANIQVAPEKVERLDDRRYGYRRTPEDIFINSHFPRLKSRDAFHKIHCLVNYLSTTDLLSKILSKEHSTEGQFKDGEILYVFGEFNWTSLINDFDESIKKVIFLYVTYDEEDNEYINEVSLKINQDDIILLSFLLESYDRDQARMNEFLTRTHILGALEHCKRHYLPDVEFQGINLKD